MIQRTGKKITRSDISRSMDKLGIREGDTVYVRADLGAVGRLAGNATDIVVGGIIDVLGESGTLMVPTFTRMSKVWDKDINLFDNNTPPISGALSKRFLKLDGVVRSLHPSHSFAAIGRNAVRLLKNHDRHATCFEPMRQMIELEGKMLLVGCIDESPGFSTVHLVQHDLNLSQKHYLKYFIRCKVYEDGNEVIYKPFETPGCSAAFGKFYRKYEEAGNLVAGNTGHALTYCVEARAAYDIEKEILERNPRFALCDDITCVSCHLTRGYNKRNIPKSIFKILSTRLAQIIR